MNWWAEGDTPVRADSHVRYCVDARSTLFTMCCRFLMAHNYIYLASWGMTPTMRLVRGTDHRAGPDGSPEQEALLAELRTEGLGEAEIDFWCSHELSVQAVLGYAVSKGVEVKVLIWSGAELFSLYNPKAVHEQLARVGVTCMIDGSAFGILHHPIESLHQKIAVVDGTHAFVGGIDPLIEPNGDFDRWDYPSHRFFEEESSIHPWHDAHAIIDRPLLGTDSPDLERNIRELGAALRRGATVAMVLPDHPNVGRAFTDAGLARLREEAPEAAAQGRIQAFCLATSADIDGEAHYRPIYVHAKVAIVDDLWSTVGSANLNNRGMRDDTEMNVAVLDAELARGLRLMLWAEHLGLVSEDDLLIVARHLDHQRQRLSVDERAAGLLQQLQEQLGNPLIGLHLMVEHAQDNLRRYKAKQPLACHLLPYLTAEEAKHQGLILREAQGWIEVAS
jgi:PLD-like domain